jgi:hypothetical protein
MPRLAEVDSQCSAALALVPPRPNLADENLRAFVLLLSAHFQGFCRDLYTECAVIVVAKVRPSLRALLQRQLTANRALDHGNPNVKNIRDDFERFDFHLDLAAADPANPARITHLGELNRWRNIAAHHGTAPTGLAPLTLPAIQAWQSACNGLAVSLDLIMYNQLRRTLRRAPWVP